jgi:hypothetical protein
MRETSIITFAVGDSRAAGQHQGDGNVVFAFPLCAECKDKPIWVCRCMHNSSYGGAASLQMSRAQQNPPLAGM